MSKLVIDGYTVALTHLDKVLYPETGTTKGEIIAYYEAIAAVMLPHIRDRPATRKRWPDGVTATPFFEKNIPFSAPDWIPRLPLEHKSRTVTYPLLNSTAALVWIGQQAALEVHVPQWIARSGKPGPANRIVFDLDPGPGTTLTDCAVVAKRIREIFREIGLAVYPVTSGSKGLHLYVPLVDPVSSAQASRVAQSVAASLERALPELVTATMSKAARPGKIFVDWSQNSAAKTTIAPYSLRGQPHPFVAAPRSWEELDDPHIEHLTFSEVLRRVDEFGDLLSPERPRPSESGPDRLALYRAKRDRALTPEPVPDPGENLKDDESEPLFVIQEHHARRLHYDFRLERDGVLVSWAVPKNIPDTPDVNHLAVQTEEHPMEYGSFAGEIPRGQYGAGKVEIWDRGTYTLEKWRDDEVIVELHGKRAQGRYALIKTGGKNWLMHKMKAPDATRRVRGIPRGLSPMLAKSAPIKRLDAGEWAFEGKWDGYRAIAEISEGTVRLLSRSGIDVTRDYPQLRQLSEGLGGHEVVLDGELVGFDEEGVTSFARLREAPREATYLVFDVLYLDGTSLTRKPWSDRRKVLEAIAGLLRCASVPPLLTGSAEEAIAESVQRGWEGVIAKRRDSIYLPGQRGTAWLKHKNWRTQNVVVGGWKPGEGGHGGGIGALLVGVMRDGKLRYAGRVGTGWSEKQRAELLERLTLLVQEKSPFADWASEPESSETQLRDVVWVRPEMEGTVRFQEWTSARRLRHPVWMRS
ncbi:ATP-dependent DNA ligase [Hoyosella altamirensis]|uniref:DNA ligase (ATP) n=1 Tax=Hoyosella altamirensis TaxID=616997 RepID=A0A839RTV9_9ACTN|nr:ATP-dependent DNA ligase [Hoyosella altamirensis]MBB3039504.1 bifunctional non-homologous end joining protein LigD [Hoyosella altamirensis]